MGHLTGPNRADGISSTGDPLPDQGVQHRPPSSLPAGYGRVGAIRWSALVAVLLTHDSAIAHRPGFVVLVLAARPERTTPPAS